MYSRSSGAPAPAPAPTAVSSIYAAQPAFPVLASSLLSARRRNQRNDTHATTPDVSPTVTTEADKNSTISWNLKTDFEKGLNLNRTQRTEDDSNSSSTNHRSIFRSGITIGFSWLKEWNPRLRDAEQDRSRERLGEVCTYITHHIYIPYLY